MKKHFAVLSAFALIAACGMAGFTAGASHVDAYGVKKAADSFKSYVGYSSEQEISEAAEDLTYDIADESMILLKNNENTLPLEGVKRVSVFGKNSTNPVLNGGGSGAGNTNGMAKTWNTYDSLENAGFKYNKSLKNFYDNNSLSGTGRVGGSFGSTAPNTIGETPVSKYPSALEKSYEDYNDAAIIYLARTGTEGNDSPRANVVDNNGDVADPSQHYFKLSVNEKAMISMVKEHFKKIVVILNTPSVMEVSDLQSDDSIGGILWLGVMGTSGMKTLGKTLSGEVNPSGRTVDTWAKDLTKDPTWNNFGDGSQGSADKATQLYHVTEDKDGTQTNLSTLNTASTDTFVRYEEGIYVGYRYYETAAADGVIDYDNTVVYPFGYGLSYTNFSQSIKSQTPAKDTVWTSNTDEVKITVTVTNDGLVAGKDVVQAYFKAPYTKGGIEKADRVLAAFGKTKLLKPGESQDVTVSFHLQDLASYDYNDANKNGFYGYELDAGNYSVTLNNNSHDELETMSYSIATGGIQYATDRNTGKDITNKFSDYKKADGTTVKTDNPSLPMADNGFGYSEMSRNTGLVQPDAISADDRSIVAGKEMDTVLRYVFDITDIEKGTTPSDTLYGYNSRKIDSTKTANYTQVAEDHTRTTEELANIISFSDIAGISYDDSRWNNILNQLKWSELSGFVSAGGYSTAALDVMGKPRMTDSDGPAGVGISVMPANITLSSTWNLELNEKYGDFIGECCLFENISGWYAPSVDTHRSAFGGRNFEYFSEDPLIAGHLCAAQVKGAKKSNIYVYIKHFALNEQETSRDSIMTFASEQAIREIYLKAFEPSFTQENCNGVMGSMNRIGLTDSYSNTALMRGILRDEWNFKGINVTDWLSAGSYTTSTTHGGSSLVISGTDIPLGTIRNQAFFGHYDATANKVMIPDHAGTKDADGNVIYTSSPSLWYSTREAAKHILYTTANSCGEKNLLNLAAFKENKALTAPTGMSSTLSIAADSTLGTTGEVYSLASGSLPDGMSLSIFGTISGTPTKTGTYNFSISMKADGWITQARDFTITVVPLVSYTGSDLSDLAINTAMTGTFATDYVKAGEGQTYDTLEYQATGLPEGLTIDAATGVISGTPTTAGTYNATITLHAGVTAHWGDYTWTNYTDFNQAQTIVVKDPNAVTEKTDAEKIADLEKELADLKTQIASITSNDGTLATKIAALETKIDALTANGTTSASDIAALKAAIEDLKTQLAAKTTSTGCGGSITVVSSVAASLTLAGLALSLKKKKEDKKTK